MVAYRDIIALVDQIARRFKPHKIILFGSYGFGTPSEDSDVDLMVVTRYRGESWRKATAIRKAIDIDFPLDIPCTIPCRDSAASGLEGLLSHGRRGTGNRSL